MPMTPEEFHLQRSVSDLFKELLEQQQTLITQQRRTERELTHGVEKIMSALDDLKKNIADLIAEGTADITALVQRQAQQASQSQSGTVSEADIAKLAQDVADATANMHSSFMAATGTPVPSTSSTGASSNATADSSSSSQSAPASSPSTPDQSASSSAGTTSIGPDSFKAGA